MKDPSCYVSKQYGKEQELLGMELVCVVHFDRGCLVLCKKSELFSRDLVPSDNS